MLRFTFILLLLFSFSANSYTGEMLLKQCISGKGSKKDLICYGYIQGSLDSVPNLRICPKRTYSGYLNETVILYLKTHPEVWKKSGAIAVVRAVKSAYPCP